MKKSVLKEIFENKIIAYYPSSALDFKDLFFFSKKEFVENKDVFANELVNFKFLPEIFIHTDNAYNFDNFPLDKPGEIFKDEIHKYSLLDIHKINLDNINGFDLKVRLDFLQEDYSVEKTVLFLFEDNKTFFKNIVLNHGLKIDFLINIRDGNNENGGSSYNMRFDEMFLAYIGCSYFVTDNIGRDFDANEILEDEILLKYYQNSNNKPAVLKGLKEFSWSENGLYCGDAHLFEIQKLM